MKKILTILVVIAIATSCFASTGALQSASSSSEEIPAYTWIALGVAIVIAVVYLGWSAANPPQPPCRAWMDEIREKYGDPEEVERYDSGDYHSVTWRFWSQGISYTFTWGDCVRNALGNRCCDVSKHTFEPIEIEK
ncbi:MAG: hypothetical protein U9Q76_07810 [candidate division WOR-3 bacterium]|nr:hypothetical protein [candidate division WOR-3 bacterium]